eukprot:Hpha_TRINITY_DN15156_c0_g2::TRINITY_DN15156_c0_g2_i2::g.128124::m.128124
MNKLMCTSLSRRTVVRSPALTIALAVVDVVFCEAEAFEQLLLRQQCHTLPLVSDGVTVHRHVDTGHAADLERPRLRVHDVLFFVCLRRLQHRVVDRPPCHKLVHVDLPPLPHPPAPSHCLPQEGQVVGGVDDENVIRHRQVQPHRAHPDRHQQNGNIGVRLKLVQRPGTCAHRHPADGAGADLGLLQCLLQLTLDWVEPAEEQEFRLRLVLPHLVEALHHPQHLRARLLPEGGVELVPRCFIVIRRLRHRGLRRGRRGARGVRGLGRLRGGGRRFRSRLLLLGGLECTRPVGAAKHLQT